MQQTAQHNRYRDNLEHSTVNLQQNQCNMHHTACTTPDTPHNMHQAEGAIALTEAPQCQQRVDIAADPSLGAAPAVHQEAVRVKTASDRRKADGKAGGKAGGKRAGADASAAQPAEL